MRPKNLNVFLRAPQPSGPKHITVTEQRAPTDESIRLYGEMVAKAKAAVESEIAVESTGVHATVWREDLGSGSLMKAKIEIGGHTIQAEVDMRRAGGREEMMKQLSESLGKKIATAALMPLLIQTGL